jgi:hypothetical protein
LLYIVTTLGFSLCLHTKKCFSRLSKYFVLGCNVALTRCKVYGDFQSLMVVKKAKMPVHEWIQTRTRLRLAGKRPYMNETKIHGMIRTHVQRWGGGTSGLKSAAWTTWPRMHIVLHLHNLMNIHVINHQYLRYSKTHSEIFNFAVFGVLCWFTQLIPLNKDNFWHWE